MNNEVVRLDVGEFDRVVGTLCDAFHEYPVMRYILKDAGEEYDARLEHLIGYFTDSRFSRGWPVLGVMSGDWMVAAANVNPPTTAERPPALERRYDRLCDALGADAIRRFHRFADACDEIEPTEPHYSLGMIGVRQAEQGRGLSRLLLESVHRMSEADPGSTGVALSTETPVNLSFYEHFGYRIVGERQVEEMRTWALFRSDRE